MAGLTPRDTDSAWPIPQRRRRRRRDGGALSTWTWNHELDTV